MSIADQLYLARESAGLTQEQLATKAGLFRSVVGRTERGETKPDVSTLELLAAALNTTFVIGEAK